MRVIAGSAKGRKLKTVPGPDVRPITDRVKESLFNILGPDIVGASFWDMFGGTGSVGIEARSRGAAFVRFVDRNRAAIKTIRGNLKTTELDGDAVEVLQGDVLSVVKNIPDREFDYIYIAPPQYQEIWLQALKEVDTRPGWMSEDAWVVVQIHPVEFKEIQLEKLVEIDRRKYGSTMLIFYERILE